jgi:hypothetical protein
VLRWLDGAGVRLVQVDGTWTSPAKGAGATLALLVGSSVGPVVPFPD